MLLQSQQKCAVTLGPNSSHRLFSVIWQSMGCCVFEFYREVDRYGRDISKPQFSMLQAAALDQKVAQAISSSTSSAQQSGQGSSSASTSSVATAIVSAIATVSRSSTLIPPSQLPLPGRTYDHRHGYKVYPEVAMARCIVRR